MVNDLTPGDHQRPAPDVRAGDAGRLRHPGRCCSAGPGICLYLIATVVLGYLASLGLTDLVFHALHRGPDPWGGLDWTVGFFLFVILVAVGEDYNIFLMARVIEEERSHGDDRGHAPGRRAHRRHHQLVRPDHGRDVRLDAHRQPDVAPRAGVRPRARRPARHVPGPADPGPRLRGPGRPVPAPPPPTRAATRRWSRRRATTTPAVTTRSSPKGSRAGISKRQPRATQTRLSDSQATAASVWSSLSMHSGEGSFFTGLSINLVLPHLQP